MELAVWIWLPNETEPVAAGKLVQAKTEPAVSGNLMPDDDLSLFAYGDSYLANPDAIPLYEPELPLRTGLLSPLKGLSIPGCIRDGSPDAWGRRVIAGRQAAGDDRSLEWEPTEMQYLIASSSDRIGALDFQASATEYVPRIAEDVDLETLEEAAWRLSSGKPLWPTLDEALLHGTSIGGSRPKAAIQIGGRKMIAKFSLIGDSYKIVNTEFAAMKLAAACGLNAAPVELAEVHNRDVLLVERFDRAKSAAGWQRKAMVSALTMFGLDEMMARYASYEKLAEIVRHRFTKPKDTLRELYGRLCFNILCGNTDDHARNHAAFWDGQSLTLTPAYDICPQVRAGSEATQGMLIKGQDRFSSLASCLNAASDFLLSENQALQIMEGQIKAIAEHFRAVLEEAQLDAQTENPAYARQFLNPFCVEQLGEKHAPLKRMFMDARAEMFG